jgi:hypothetical protein
MNIYEIGDTPQYVVRCSTLRQCATVRKVAGSIPNIFRYLN